jgi:hypothetical protein
MASSNQTIFLTGQADQTSFRDGRWGTSSDTDGDHIRRLGCSY